MRSRSGVVAAAALVVGATSAAGPAAAQEPTLVDVFGCALFEGGATTAPAGPLEAFVGAWGTGPRGALVHWVNSQETTVTIDDGPAVDVSGDFTAPRTPLPNGEKGWFSELIVPIGELAAGDTVKVSFETTWSKPTVDFFFGSHPTVLRGGETSGSCVITGQ